MTTEDQLSSQKYALHLINKFIIKKHPELAAELANDLFKDLEINQGAPWVGYSIMLALSDYRQLDDGMVDTVFAVCEDSIKRNQTSL
ncbi:hypothetical protein [Psychrobacter sp. B29-1]|uniref:hypothetical protein n=1 Tax=Psychrobacter sp. B29-1 TaxID=1867800 RepID=UPI0025EDB62A|nr:hypothetical protein [Psychrobacter sp. B29-1]